MKNEIIYSKSDLLWELKDVIQIISFEDLQEILQNYISHVIDEFSLSGEHQFTQAKINLDDDNNVCVKIKTFENVNKIGIDKNLGIQIWYKDGKFHRDGELPSVVSDKYFVWWKNGEVMKREKRNIE